MAERSDKARTASSKDRAADETGNMDSPDMFQFSPSNMLDQIPDTDGYRYRWIAEYVNGQHMNRNVSGAMREGYQRVSIDKVPGNVLLDTDAQGDGFARSGGLILMRVPLRVVEQRENYYRNRSQSALQGVNALQGVAGQNAVEEDRGTKSLTGAEAGAALRNLAGH